MPWNGSGGFNREEDFTADLAAGPPASIVSAAKVDDEFDNFKNGLQNCLTRDGQNSPSANISFANFKITSLGAPTAGGDAANKTYVDGGAYLGTLVNGLTAVTPAVGDLIGIADVSDSNNPKKVTVQNIIDLVPAPTFTGIRAIQSTTKSDTSTLTTLNAWTDIPGMSVTITPVSTSNKILVTVDLSVVAVNTDGKPVGVRLVRDSTAIGIADAAGSRTRASKAIFAQISGASTQADNLAITHLDSPATTSAITYKVQYYFPSRLGSEALYINRDATDTNASDWFRGTSSITAMEYAV